MQITHEFQIPKNTPRSNVQRQVFDLGVNGRIIKSISIVIPEGHKGLAYMRAYTPGYPIIPAPGSSVQFIRGDDQTIPPTLINRAIEGPPFNLICEGYNEDAYLPHTFIINIEV